MKYNSAWLKLVVIALFIAYSQHAYTQANTGRKLDDIVVKVRLLKMPDIQNSKEMDDFYGKDDAVTPSYLQDYKINKWALGLCFSSIMYRNKGSEPYLPGELPSHRIIATALLSDLYVIAGMDMDYDRATIYAKASKPYEAAFTQKISMQAKHSLEPKDVLRIALEVTNGDYGLAVLTVHYVFKYTAYKIRGLRDEIRKDKIAINNALSFNPERDGAIQSVKNYNKRYQKAINQIRELNKVVIPLKSLRANPKKSNDKMGTWYHIFALLVVDAYGGSAQAITAASGEHTLKAVKGFAHEGGLNPEKASIDLTFISAIAMCHKTIEQLK